MCTEQQCSTLCNSVQLYRTACKSVQLCTTVCNSVQQCTTLNNSVQHWTTIYIIVKQPKISYHWLHTTANTWLLPVPLSCLLSSPLRWGFRATTTSCLSQLINRWERRTSTKICEAISKCLVQTVESLKGLSGKFAQGPAVGKFSNPEDFPLFVRLWA